MIKEFCLEIKGDIIPSEMLPKFQNQLKKEDSYKKVYKHYVEGRIKLQLEIANLITQISAQYIFHEKAKELKIIKEDALYWIFENGNKYTKKFYTKEKATELNSTLVNCKNCYDCYNCKNLADKFNLKNKTMGVVEIHNE